MWMPPGWVRVVFQPCLGDGVKNWARQHSWLWGAGCNSLRSNPLPPQEMEKADFCPHCNFLPHSFSFCLLFHSSPPPPRLPLPRSLHPHMLCKENEHKRCFGRCDESPSIYGRRAGPRKINSEESAAMTLSWPAREWEAEVWEELCLTSDSNTVGLPHVCGCGLTHRFIRQETRYGPALASSFFCNNAEEEVCRGSFLFISSSLSRCSCLSRASPRAGHKNRTSHLWGGKKKKKKHKYNR